jgi:hypothetical protein
VNGLEIVPRGGIPSGPGRYRDGAARPAVRATSVVPFADDLPPIVLSDPLDADLYIYRGDSGRFRVTVTDVNGVPLNVSGATWDCDIRAEEDATVVLATLTVTPVAGDTSSVDVSLTAAQSRALDDTAAGWDLEMTMSGEVLTLVTGLVVVTKDWSRTP